MATIPTPHIVLVEETGPPRIFVPYVPPIDPPDPPDPEPGISGTVTITFPDGTSFTFDPADGIGLETWHDPLGVFEQDCILCTHPGLPAFRAYYRPDVGTDREEWVFELGDPHLMPVRISIATTGDPSVITTAEPHGLRTGYFARIDGLSYSGGNVRQQVVTVIDDMRFSIPVAVTSTNANATVGPWDLGAYTATVTKTDDSTETIQVPEHLQYGRWRWQSKPRPVRRWTNGEPCTALECYSELVVFGLLPQYDQTLAIHPIQPAPTYVPMSLCGLPSDQGQTGGGGYIGYITSWQADALFRGAPEDAWRAYAEVAGSYQWNIRDPATHAPISLDTYPKASIGWNSGENWIPKTDRNRPEAGHMPTLSYVPFLLTGDPYHLESLQFYSNMAYIIGPSTPPARFSLGAGHRYIAWPLRNWGQTLVSTPDVVPEWLLPREYALARLDASRAVLEPKMLSDDPYSWLHHAVPLDGNLGDTVWQHGFLSLVCSWLVLAGRSEWRSFAEWLIQGEVDRASSTSGYQRSTPSPYSLYMRNVQALGAALSATDDLLVFKAPVPPFQVGEVLTIDSPTEQVTLVSCVTADRTTWEIERPTPKAHNSGVNCWGAKYTNWESVMEANRIMAPERWTAPTPPNELYAPTDLEYPSFHSAAMAVAIQAKLEAPELEANAAWLVAEIRKQLQAKHIGSNWAIAA